MGLLNKLQKTPNKESSKETPRKSSGVTETTGRHAIARRSVRDRSVSNLTSDLNSTTSPRPLSGAQFGSIKRQRSTSTPKTPKRRPSDIVKSKIGHLNHSKHSQSSNIIAQSPHSAIESSPASTKVSNKISTLNNTKSWSANTNGNESLDSGHLDTKNESVTKDSSGIFSSLVSAAHSAASHLMPKTTEKPLTDDVSQHPPRNSSALRQTVPQDQQSSAFLKHLDFLLSPGPMAQHNSTGAYLSPSLSHTATNKSLASSHDRHSSVTSGTPSIFVRNHDDLGSDGETEIMSLTDGIQFHPRKGESHIATFGRGDLTLDALGKASFASTGAIGLRIV